MSGRYQRQKAKFWGQPIPDGLKHGTNSHARKMYGCQCEDCRPSRESPGSGASHADRQRKLRQAKRGTPVPPGVKHGIYAYKVYGCPCDICVASNNRARRRRRQSWRTKATGSWGSGKDGTDVLHWPPVGVGTWTCPACGQQFRHRAPKEETIAA